MNNEPVAWMQTWENQDGELKHTVNIEQIGKQDIPLYTQPSEYSKAKDRFPNYESICLQCGTTIYKPFKEITDEEIKALWKPLPDTKTYDSDVLKFARAILKRASEK